MNNRKSPLSSEAALNILVTLEEQIITDSVRLDTLQKSFTIMTDLIEYYDTQKDPIKIYFVEKLQILLSNRKINQMLEKEKAQGNTVGKQEFIEQTLTEKKKIRQKQLKVMNEIMESNQKGAQSVVQNII